MRLLGVGGVVFGCRETEQVTETNPGFWRDLCFFGASFLVSSPGCD